MGLPSFGMMYKGAEILKKNDEANSLMLDFFIANKRRLVIIKFENKEVVALVLGVKKQTREIRLFVIRKFKTHIITPSAVAMYRKPFPFLVKIKTVFRI